MSGILIIALWLGCGAWAGVIARKKGRSFLGWFMIGLLFGIFGVLFAWGVRPSGEWAAHSQRCPRCGVIRHVDY